MNWIVHTLLEKRFCNLSILVGVAAYLELAYLGTYWSTLAIIATEGLSRRHTKKR